ncbi:MAG: GCN5-related N-acetyltransferase [Betaproteobacteria bacterium]|nr:GCN5-related N-acetyltransferase [Betaproteobacteria bacterium]
MSADATPVIEVSAINADDIDALCALAALIWRAHYPAIISAAQIEYMLAQRYAPHVLRAELVRDGLWWDKLTVDGHMRGFCSYFLVDGGEMKLDKVYVHPECQRRGYGRLLIERAAQGAREHACKALTLAVNKHNGTAIAMYRKQGFEIVGSVVKDIGAGFAMDDYVMRRHV